MNKIDDLLERLDRMKLARDMEPDPDGLSLSLFNLCQELAGLDTLGKSALLYELNHGDTLEGTMGLDLSMQDLDRMIEGMMV